MGTINVQRVLLGGLVAGVVLNIVDFVLYGVILKDDMAAAMLALGKPPMPDSSIIWFVLLDFAYGIFLVWLYAAIRPRFGPGPGTAAKAGFAVWVFYGLLNALGEGVVGLVPQNLLLIMSAVMLVEYPLAAVAGAKVYTES